MFCIYSKRVLRALHFNKINKRSIDRFNILPRDVFNVSFRTEVVNNKTFENNVHKASGLRYMHSQIGKAYQHDKRNGLDPQGPGTVHRGQEPYCSSVCLV